MLGGFSLVLCLLLLIGPGGKSSITYVTAVSAAIVTFVCAAQVMRSGKRE
ncbi:hypothetical protein HNQ79_005549 [Streptomyces candidus]|uniref:Uncharacterized protein n=1 Tax=Streptomyces candidus TaxID=67283 RepID=A0A7X0HJX9_9ACTN|nr:hypothetical protein [Streptomyces candidus]